MVINNLLSGLTIRSQSLWDARGVRVTESDPPPSLTLQKRTDVRGQLHFDTAILLQEHEYTRSTHILYRTRADHVLVGMVLDTLVKWNVTIQRVEEAAPRFDFTGKQLERLAYWDIIGYRYHLDTLDSFDIHVVITGNYQTSMPTSPLAMKSDASSQMHQYGGDTTPTTTTPDTHLELTIRCVHDPRNDDIWKRADTLLQAIAQDLEPFQEPMTNMNHQDHGFCTIHDQLTITLAPHGEGWRITVHNIASPDTRIHEVTVTLTPPYNVVASTHRFEFGEILHAEQDSAFLMLRMYTTAHDGHTRTSLDTRIRETEAHIAELEDQRRLALTPTEARRMELEREKQRKFLGEYEHQRKSLAGQKEAQIKFDVTYLINNNPIVTRHEGELDVDMLAQ